MRSWSVVKSCVLKNWFALQAVKPIVVADTQASSKLGASGVTTAWSKQLRYNKRHPTTHLDISQREHTFKDDSS